MKKFLVFILLSFFIISCSAQQNNLNLNFETVENNFPKGWTIFGDGSGNISTNLDFVKEGKASVQLEIKNGSGFKALALTLPQIYAGKEITLSGYIKTENVSQDFAGLWMRIDPDVAFDNMQSRGIKGTTDWTKYEVTLKMQPEETKQIVLGAILSGDGKMWVDDLKITIDGKDISKALVYEKKISKSDLDTEFNYGSNINLADLSKNNIENLKVLGLVWGYLKYYHPEVATGNLNWDYELFRMVSKMNSKNSTERDDILSSWIENLGIFKIEKVNFPKSDVKLTPDLNWITNSGLSQKLSAQLLQIKDAKRNNSNYYLEFEREGNPKFTNENGYDNIKFPDQGYQLLSLFRYWNMIQYYFPYKNLIDEDWKDVLEEMIPKFLNAKDKTEYALANLEMIARIHDTHANIWNYPELYSYFGTKSANAQIRFVDNQAVVTDFYNTKSNEETEFLLGDVIIEINGKSISAIIKENLKILPASNYDTQLRNLSYRLLRTNSESISFKILRDGKIINKTLKSFNLNDLAVKKEVEENYFKMLNPEIAYITLAKVDSKNFKEVFESIQNTKGLVIDIRNYPSEFVVFKMGKLLKPKSTEFVKFTKSDHKNPGLFKFLPSASIPGSSNYYKGKIAILINEQTQSQAEFTAMAFRTAPNSKVFGSTTAGADGNVSSISLPGGINTMISGLGVYYPDGKETQRIGIVPDVEIKPTIKGIKDGKDEVLEKAVEWIRK